MTEHTADLRYMDRLISGERVMGDPNSQSPSVEHYWRWPIMVRFRPMLGISIHGVRDGVVRGQGPFHPAVRTFIWLGPIGLELGWRRQAIENWRWRRRLRKGESR